MSRYLILIILNAPLIVFGVVNTIVAYKLRVLNKQQFLLRLILWIVILIGLVFMKSVYDFLFSNDLTRTEPLSLFDVIQITGIIFILLIATRAYTKADQLERQLQEMHQQLSIRLSEDMPRRASTTKRR